MTRRPANFAYAIVDQGLFSLCGFVFLLTQARILGPGGYGVVALAFVWVTLGLTIARSAVSSVVATDIAGLSAEERAVLIGRSKGIGLILGGLVAIPLLLAALVTPAAAKGAVIALAIAA